MMISFASIVLYWVYMNGSRCHEDMGRWAFPFRGYLANEWGP